MNLSRFDLQAAICTATMALCLTSQCQAAIIAFDMVDSRNQNLIAFNNPYHNAFGSVDDTFQKHRLGTTLPGANLIDSSTLGAASDDLGIVNARSDQHEFFAAQDIDNSDNPGGRAEASWLFDISGYSAIELSVDIAAMGDFESSDFFQFEFAINGSSRSRLFDLNTNTSVTQNYTLASGQLINLDDPLQLLPPSPAGAVLLNNRFSTVQADIGEEGSQLELFFSGQQNGGNEVIAFRNIVLRGDATQAGPDQPLPGPPTLALMGLVLLGWRCNRKRTSKVF